MYIGYATLVGVFFQSIQPLGPSLRCPIGAIAARLVVRHADGVCAGARLRWHDEAAINPLNLGSLSDCDAPFLPCVHVIYSRKLP